MDFICLKPYTLNPKPLAPLTAFVCAPGRWSVWSSAATNINEAAASVAGQPDGDEQAQGCGRGHVVRQQVVTRVLPSLLSGAVLSAGSRRLLDSQLGRVKCSAVYVSPQRASAVKVMKEGQEPCLAKEHARLRQLTPWRFCLPSAR